MNIITFYVPETVRWITGARPDVFNQLLKCFPETYSPVFCYVSTWRHNRFRWHSL